jgi:hypothetical protein
MRAPGPHRDAGAGSWMQGCGRRVLAAGMRVPVALAGRKGELAGVRRRWSSVQVGLGGEGVWDLLKKNIWFFKLD